jgi:hypothetical protein
VAAEVVYINSQSYLQHPFLFEYRRRNDGRSAQIKVVQKTFVLPPAYFRMESSVQKKTGSLVPVFRESKKIML